MGELNDCVDDDGRDVKKVALRDISFLSPYCELALRQRRAMYQILFDLTGRKHCTSDASLCLDRFFCIFAFFRFFVAFFCPLSSISLSMA